MFTSISFFVKQSEIDNMGIVHHSNYPKWLAIARKDYLHKAGVPHTIINLNGFYLPLSELECKFKSPAKYGDEIKIITAITFMSCVKVKFEYRVLNKKNGKTLAFGKTTHAWTDKSITPVNIEKSAPHIFTSLKALIESTKAQI